jgi:acyl-ACP thioesterase
VQRSRIYPATIAALEIASAMDVAQKFIKRFVKRKIEIMIRNSHEKVFETECVFVIVDRAVIALATRFKQLAEYVDKFSLKYEIKKFKDTKEEDLAVRYMKLQIV